MKVFNRDLVAAELATSEKVGKKTVFHKKDARGRVLDIHSLRMTFSSMLAAAGVPLTTAQYLMRHSDPKLTASVYTDPETLDLHGAVGALPVADAREVAQHAAEVAKGAEDTPSHTPPPLTPEVARRSHFSSSPGSQAGKQRNISDPGKDNKNPQCLPGSSHEQRGLKDEKEWYRGWGSNPRPLDPQSTCGRW